jgi:single-stranded-DNA-specific exonuclease
MSTLHREMRVRSCAAAETLPAELPALLRRVYAARKVQSVGELSTQLSSLLPVGTLPGVDAAAALLLQHLERRVLIVGDFDADGATSTALMVRALRDWGFRDVQYMVPDRFLYGYGLTPAIVEAARERAPSLIVTVDNGISSIEGVAAAKNHGVQVLVTDHHLPGESLPDADIIVNPNLPGCAFGSRALAGVGVAFYVLAAVQRALQAAGRWLPSYRAVTQWLDLVAVGTVADLVALDANNRVLVAQGLARIRAGVGVPGVLALLEVAKRHHGEAVAADLGFSVGPRLNAAGRLEDMSVGIRCLLTDDKAEAQALAEELDQLNRQRREIEADMQATAVAAVKGIGLRQADTRHAGVCLYDAAWHQGVVGLVASRVKDRIARPVIAFAPSEDVALLRGSARSIASVHIRDVLESIATQHPELILRFGGHAMAAGLTVKATDLDRFARAFDAAVGAWLRNVETDDAVWTDGELQEADMSLPTAQLLRDAGPWGQGFPEPSFVGEFEIESARVLGERHVKFWLRPANSRARFDAIAFNLLDGERFAAPPTGRCRMAYRLDINHWQGERRLQLLIEHVDLPV